MTLSPLHPVRDMMILRDAMDRAFQESVVRLTNTLLGRGGSFVPMNIRETGDGYEVDAALPGVRPEDVQITVEGGTLTVRGETTSEQVRTGQTYIAHERRGGRFYRSITLPAPVNAEQAHARFDRGILRLTLPKADLARPRRIPVSGVQNAAGSGAPQADASADDTLSGLADTSADGASPMGTADADLTGPDAGTNGAGAAQQQPS